MIRRKLGSIQATVTSAGTPVRLCPVEGRLVTHRVEIYPKKSSTVANTGNIKIGTATGSAAISGITANKQPITLGSSDAPKVFDAGDEYIDLYDIIIDAATSGDGVVAYYI